jgi:hypothetical protein
VKATAADLIWLRHELALYERHPNIILELDALH